MRARINELIENSFCYKVLFILFSMPTVSLIINFLFRIGNYLGTFLRKILAN